MTNQYDPSGSRQSKPGILPAEAEQQLRNDAASLAGKVQDEAATVAAEVGQQAGAVVEEAKAELGKVADKAKSMAEQQKEAMAGEIETVADAVSKVARELEASEAGVAGYARTLSDTVSRFSETVKNKDVDELLSMAEQFGRRQPAAFMGVAALAGFAASRFLVASARRASATPQSPATGAYSDGAAPAYGNGSGNTASAHSYRPDGQSLSERGGL